MIGEQFAGGTNGKARVSLGDTSSDRFPRSRIIGHGRAITRVLAEAEHVAQTDATVLLLGETGTGKELLARVIHDRSSRRERAMVKVNCAALPSTLV